MHSRIKALRESAGLTQSQLANIIKKSRSAVADYERNYARPTQPNLWKIAKALNVSVDDLYQDGPLLNGEEHPPAEEEPAHV